MDGTQHGKTEVSNGPALCENMRMIYDWQKIWKWALGLRSNKMEFLNML